MMKWFRLEKVETILPIAVARLFGLAIAGSDLIFLEPGHLYDDTLLVAWWVHVSSSIGVELRGNGS
jgi:hypothetical protein